MTVTPKVVLVLLMLAVILSPSAGKSENREPTVEPGPLWLLGDSIGVGVHWSLARRGVPHVSHVAYGRSLRDVVANLPLHGDPPRGAVVVLSVGTNDWVSEQLRREFGQNLDRVQRWADERGVSLFWLEPPASEVVLTIAGHREPRTIWRRVPMADRWHPTVAGYDQLAAEVLRVLGRDS